MVGIFNKLKSLAIVACMCLCFQIQHLYHVRELPDPAGSAGGHVLPGGNHFVGEQSHRRIHYDSAGNYQLQTEGMYIIKCMSSGYIGVHACALRSGVSCICLGSPESHLDVSLRLYLPKNIANNVILN